MKTAILGNGPSLNLNQQFYQDYDCVLLTNRLIWEEFAAPNTRLIYVCSDIRFKKSVEWLQQIRTKSIDIFLSDDLYEEVIGFVPKENIFSYSSLAASTLLSRYMRDFPLMQNLRSNVVLDLAIPVAIFIGSMNIKLFGCEFDYDIKIHNDKPSYYSNYNSRNIPFDHDQSSASYWANVSNDKYNRIVTLLHHAGIALSK